MRFSVSTPQEFLSTLSLRRATRATACGRRPTCYFYPRSPCGERLIVDDQLSVVHQFLSTLSLRRATGSSRRCPSPSDHFYPRSPCGERRYTSASHWRDIDISIHALLAESDAPLFLQPKGSRHFYPRSPCGERRWLRCWQLAARDISIHALLAESDVEVPTSAVSNGTFLSTLSLRRATASTRTVASPVFYFYPRSPCGERPGCQQPCGRPTTHFYPRSPCGERPPASAGHRWRAAAISIHALLAESDAFIHSKHSKFWYFYPRSPCGERHIFVNTFLAIF